MFTIEAEISQRPDGTYIFRDTLGTTYRVACATTQANLLSVGTHRLSGIIKMPAYANSPATFVVIDFD